MAEEAKSRRGRMKRASKSSHSFSAHKMSSQEGTLRSEWSKRESTLVESEGNPRDTLNARVRDLEDQVAEAEDRYEELTAAARGAREMFEKEREDCEDTVSVAKRNVERIVCDILERQRRKKELQKAIEDSQQGWRRQQEERARVLAKEEERLNRNIVLLQTKLLILEGRLSERDSLVAGIEGAEEELEGRRRSHERGLAEARWEAHLKCKRLQSSLVDCTRAMSVDTERLSLTQQVCALGMRQSCILDTQSSYRRGCTLMLRLHDRNRELREKRRALQTEVDVSTALAHTLSAQQPQGSCTHLFPDSHQVDGFDALLLEEMEKDLEKRIFERNDYREDLKRVLTDQKEYKKRLDSREDEKDFLHGRMTGMSQVAEALLAKERQASGIQQQKVLESKELLQEMSTILFETTEEEVEIEQTTSQSRSDSIERLPYAKGLLGLVPGLSRPSSKETYS